MNMTHVYIPLADGTKIPDAVIQSISAQGLVSIHPVSRPGSKTQSDYGQDRINGEVASREAIRMEVIDLKEDLVVIQDSDVVHLKNTNFQDMKGFLKSNEDYGAIALSTTEQSKLEQDHVPLQCVMIHVKILDKIQFKATPTACSCLHFGADVRRLGYRYGYFDYTARIKEIQRN